MSNPFQICELRKGIFTIHHPLRGMYGKAVCDRNTAKLLRDQAERHLTSPEAWIPSHRIEEALNIGEKLRQESHGITL